MDKSQGQIDYEADVAARPLYHDGKPRPTWDDLDDLARWSWCRHMARAHQSTSS